MKIDNRQLKIAVLAGGVSSERQISLQSGRCVADALGEAGFEVIISDVKPDDLGILDDDSIDVFFVALHGEFGEDGQLQRILEARNLCYTGSTASTCETAMDKIACKEIFRTAGLDVPAAIRFDGSVDSIEPNIPGEKYVVKPSSQGSSFGVSIVDNAEQVVDTAKLCLAEYGSCMVEQFIAGREITVGVIDGQALPILEVRPKAGFYDYNAKYLDDATEYLFDTINDRRLAERISRDAVKCFESLGCRHFARVDFILTDDDEPYVLEINTIPGMTTHSCVPKAAAKISLSMPQLCARIIEAAMGIRSEK